MLTSATPNRRRGQCPHDEPNAAGRRLAPHDGGRLGAVPRRPADRGRPDRGGRAARRRFRRRGGRRPRPDRAPRPRGHPSAHVAVGAADDRVRLDPRSVLRPDAGPARRLSSGPEDTFAGHPARHGRGARLRHHHGRRLVAQPQRPRPRRRGMGRARSRVAVERSSPTAPPTTRRWARTHRPTPGRGPAPQRRRLRRPCPGHPGDGRARTGVLRDRDVRRRLGAGPGARAARHRPCGWRAPRDTGRGRRARRARTARARHDLRALQHAQRRRAGHDRRRGRTGLGVAGGRGEHGPRSRRDGPAAVPGHPHRPVRGRLHERRRRPLRSHAGGDRPAARARTTRRRWPEARPSGRSP